MLTRRIHEPHPMTRLHDEVDRLFERFFGVPDPFGLRRFPAINMWQDGDCVYVEAELPGLTREDVELSVTGNELTLRGTRKKPELPEGAHDLRIERGTGEFSRVIHLPVDVDATKVEATFRNGVLIATLPKAAIARARVIPVKTAAE